MGIKTQRKPKFPSRDWSVCIPSHSGRHSQRENASPSILTNYPISTFQRPKLSVNNETDLQNRWTLQILCLLRILTKLPTLLVLTVPALTMNSGTWELGMELCPWELCAAFTKVGVQGNVSFLEGLATWTPTLNPCRKEMLGSIHGRVAECFIYIYKSSELLMRVSYP